MDLVFMAVEVFLLTGTGLHAAGLPQAGVQAQKTSKTQLKFTLSMHTQRSWRNIRASVAQMRLFTILFS